MYDMMYAGIAADNYRREAEKQAKAGRMLRALRKDRKERSEGPATQRVAWGKLASTDAH